MHMSVVGHHGLFWALCQFSVKRFSFGFISKNEIKGNGKKKEDRRNKGFQKNQKMKIKEIKKGRNKTKVKNKTKITLIIKWNRKKYICQLSATIQVFSATSKSQRKIIFSYLISTLLSERIISSKNDFRLFLLNGLKALKHIYILLIIANSEHTYLTRFTLASIKESNHTHIFSIHQKIL